MTGNKLKTTLLAVLAGLVGLTACQDLDVENPNAPDRSRALATPGDVESLIGGAYLNYFNYAQSFTGHGPALSVASDEHTASWGNFGMKHFGNEPRLAIDNNPSWSYAYVIENPWYWSYGSISAVSDGLKAIEGGLEIGEGGEDTPRARAFAKFMQGISHAALAASYDQAFVFDETVDLSTAELELKPYGEVMTAAMGYLQEALSIASNNSFTLKPAWIKGRELSSAQFARMIHSYMARYKASVARGPDEASQVDWTSVVDHIDSGIQEDFYIQGTSFTGEWWSGFKSYGGWFPIWGRTDLRLLGPADTDGDWQSWEATPPEQRQPFLLNTPDRRLTQGIDQPKTAGKYLTYYDNIFFVPGRGTYHFSNYGDIRYPHPSSQNQIVDMSRTEMDLLKAEAMIRVGNRQQAADLINKTRTANGELPPVTPNGVPQSETCVPQTEQGECGSLMDALQYEKRIETWHESAGVQFFDMRRWGELEPGTPLHLPLPGAELQVLQKEIYTFGGNAGGAAPSIGADSDASLAERIQYDLEALRAQQKAAVQSRPSVKQ